jgi:outer membrane protein TolC
MNQSSGLPRWISAVSGILCMVLVFTAISPVTMAQQAAAQAQASAKPSTSADLPSLPLSPIEKAQKDGTAIPLSLKDITKLALQNNLDIAIQDTNEAMSQQRIRQTYGDYDPKLTGTLGLSSQKTAVTQITSQSSASFNKSETASWNFTFSQSVKTGGTIQATWNTQRLDNNSYVQSFNPQYSGTTSITFTQPLLKNLRIDSTRSNIKLYNLDLKNTDSQFKQKVTDTVSNIQTQYWSLVSAIRDYSIKRDSVQLARINLRDNRKKVEVGTLAPIDVTDAEATVAQREVDLISSEETLLSQENALRALVSSNRSSEIWKQVIVPTDTPEFKEYKVNLEDAINTALANRPEIEQSQISISKIDINRKLLDNNRKWQFDAIGSFGSQGVSGPQSYQKDLYGNLILSNGLPVSTTPESLVGGLGNSYKTIFTEGFINWSIRFQLSIPLRNRSLDAQIAQQDISKRQELMKRKQTEQTIQVDVRNAVQQIETRRNQVKTAEASRRFSQERLEGEQKRFEAGLSQNYLVLQRQNELASAEYTYLQAQINYKKSIITLQKAMYTLLESNDFEIAKGSSDKPAFK